MVLSMLSAIQSVSKLRSNASSSILEEESEMSRRKQKNPKPFFSSNEDETETENDEEDPLRCNKSESEDEFDLSSLVKVEVIERSSPPRVSSPPILSSLPQLTPMPISLSSPLEDFLSKNNLVHFGDVSTVHVPGGSSPIPLVLPMVYLYPLSESLDGGLQYRMFIPLHGCPPPPLPLPSDSLPSLAKRKTPPLSVSVTSSSSIKKESPLDLSKSPEESENERRSLESETDSSSLPHYLKVKHLEFLKSSSGGSAFGSGTNSFSGSLSRCEECNINFSKPQNYAAHKKYYCSGTKDDKDESLHKSPSPSGSKRLESLTSTSTSSLLLKKEMLLSAAAAAAAAVSLPPSRSPRLLPASSSSSHFVCDGCGIKFKSLNNLSAHQARYCAGLRKQTEDLTSHPFELLLKKQQQVQQQQLSAAEMMSFLNAKSLEAALTASGSSKDDFCCILCGFKEQSLESLKTHINSHFMCSSKRKGNSEPETETTVAPSSKKIKVERDEYLSESPPPPLSPNGNENKDSIKCESCNIGFTHFSNFLAHKQYYCRGSNSQASSSASTS